MRQRLCCNRLPASTIRRQPGAPAPLACRYTQRRLPACSSQQANVLCLGPGAGKAPAPPPAASRRSWKDGLFGLRKSSPHAPRPAAAGAAAAADDFSPLGAALPFSYTSARPDVPPFSLASTGAQEHEVHAEVAAEAVPPPEPLPHPGSAEGCGKGGALGGPRSAAQPRLERSVAGAARTASGLPCEACEVPDEEEAAALGGPSGACSSAAGARCHVQGFDPGSEQAQLEPDPAAAERSVGAVAQPGRLAAEAAALVMARRAAPAPPAPAVAGAAASVDAGTGGAGATHEAEQEAGPEVGARPLAGAEARTPPGSPGARSGAAYTDAQEGSPHGSLGARSGAFADAEEATPASSPYRLDGPGDDTGGGGCDESGAADGHAAPGAAVRVEDTVPHWTPGPDAQEPGRAGGPAALAGRPSGRTEVVLAMDDDDDDECSGAARSQARWAHRAWGLSWRSSEQGRCASGACLPDSACLVRCPDSGPTEPAFLCQVAWVAAACRAKLCQQGAADACRIFSGSKKQCSADTLCAAPFRFSQACAPYSEESPACGCGAVCSDASTVELEHSARSPGAFAAGRSTPASAPTCETRIRDPTDDLPAPVLCDSPAGVPLLRGLPSPGSGGAAPLAGSGPAPVPAHPDGGAALAASAPPAAGRLDDGSAGSQACSVEARDVILEAEPAREHSAAGAHGRRSAPACAGPAGGMHAAAGEPEGGADQAEDCGHPPGPAERPEHAAGSQGGQAECWEEPAEELGGRGGACAGNAPVSAQRPNYTLPGTEPNALRAAAAPSALAAGALPAAARDSATLARMPGADSGAPGMPAAGGAAGLEATAGMRYAEPGPEAGAHGSPVLSGSRGAASAAVPGAPPATGAAEPCGAAGAAQSGALSGVAAAAAAPAAPDAASAAALHSPVLAASGSAPSAGSASALMLEPPAAPERANVAAAAVGAEPVTPPGLLAAMQAQAVGAAGAGGAEGAGAEPGGCTGAAAGAELPPLDSAGRREVGRPAQNLTSPSLPCQCMGTCRRCWPVFLQAAMPWKGALACSLWFHALLTDNSRPL